MYFCGIDGKNLLKNVFLVSSPAFLYFMQLYNGWSVVNSAMSFRMDVKLFICTCSFAIAGFMSSWMVANVLDVV